MSAPFNNLRSKLDRAICAYIVSQPDCGTKDDVLPGNSSAKRGYPNTTVRSTLSKPEENFTGNRRVNVHISIKGQVAPNDDGASQTAFDTRVANTYDALLQTDDEQTLKFTAAEITTAGRALAVDASNGADPVQVAFAAANADMADFTCLDWYEAGEGDGPADAPGCSWENILLFDAVACPSAIN